jgi:hypothetical protein
VQQFDPSLVYWKINLYYLVFALSILPLQSKVSETMFSQTKLLFCETSILDNLHIPKNIHQLWMIEHDTLQILAKKDSIYLDHRLSRIRSTFFEFPVKSD